MWCMLNDNWSDDIFDWFLVLKEYISYCKINSIWYTNTLDKEKDFKQANLGSFMRKNVMNNHNMLFLW